MPAGELRTVAHALCRPSPTQPRITFARMDELAASVKDAGIRERLLVRAHPAEYTLHEPNLIHDNWIVQDKAGHEQSFASENEAVLLTGGEAGFKPWFELVDGERRWRAAGLAGLTEVPVEMRDMTDAEVIEYQLMSFAQKEGLNEIEEGAVFRKLIDGGEHTVESLVLKTGKSRSHIFGRLSLLKLEGPIREALAGGALPVSHASLFATIPTAKMQARALKEVLEGGEWDHDAGKQGVMSFRAAKRHIENKYMLDLADAPFETNKTGLVEGVGTCLHCPKRSANCRDLFPHIKDPNVCTDLDCFEKKKSAHIAAQRAAVEASGKTVLTAKETKGMFKYSSQPSLDGTAFASLETRVPGDPKNRTFKQLLGKEAPKPVVVIAPNGKDYEVFRKDEMINAVKESGFDFVAKAEAEAKKSLEQKAQENEAKKFREQLAPKLTPEVLAAIEEQPNNDKSIEAFLRVLLACRASANWYETRGTLNGRGIKWNSSDDINKVTAKLKLGELKGLLMEMVGLTGDDGAGALDYEGDWNKGFKLMCALAGIDLAAREKEFRNPVLPGEKFEKAAAKAKPKPKAAKVKKGGRK